MNLANETRLNIQLDGTIRKHLESTLLPYADWKAHPEMPGPCWHVVTGEAFYCGCEGIGYNQENGWYLVLWNPSDDHPAPLSGGDVEIGGGLVVVGAQICGGPTKQDQGTLTLLFMERGTVTISANEQSSSPNPAPGPNSNKKES